MITEYIIKRILNINKFLIEINMQFLYPEEFQDTDKVIIIKRNSELKTVKSHVSIKWMAITMTNHM